MTWYAQHVYAQPHDEVIAAFQSIPGMADAIYHVPHLHAMESEEQVVDGVILGNDDGLVDLYRTARRGPRLPADGLLIVRELCGSSDRDCAEWFGDDAVSWNNIGDDLSDSDDPILEFDTVFANAPDWWRDMAPPRAMLRHLKALAVRTRSIIAYYACHMWGGDVECVFGWVWDGGRESSCFYRGVVASDAEGRETTCFYTDLTGAYAIDHFGRRLIIDGDVLTLIFLHFGLLLRNGYSELHTRSFPWGQYRLGANDG